MGMQASSAMTMGNASSDAAMMNNLNVGVQFGTAESQPAMQGQRIIDMDVSNFAFSPSTVHLKKGEKVAIRLHGKEGKHGFGSADLGINVTVDAGQTVVSIPTDKAGTFAFRCTVPCGPGHMNMQGSIVIE
jgi:cytochrome c oxidase subunit 2